MNVPGSGFITALPQNYWATALNGSPSAIFFGGVIQSNNAVAIGANGTDFSSTGTVEAASFAYSNGAVLWQETVDAVTAQYCGYGAGRFVHLDGNGKIRFVCNDIISGQATMRVNSLNSDGSLSAGTKITTSEQLSSWGAALDSSNNFYVAATHGSGQRLYKFDSSNALVSQTGFSGLHEFGAYCCVVASGSNLILATNSNVGGVTYLGITSIKNDFSAVNWSEYSTASLGGYAQNAAIDVDASGNIYITGYQSSPGTAGSVSALNSSGAHLWLLSLTSSGGAVTLTACTVTASGLMVAAHDASGNCFLLLINLATGAIIWQSKITASGGIRNIEIRSGSNFVYIFCDQLVVMKLPLSTPLPNGTYGAWTFATGTLTGIITAPAITSQTVTLTAVTAASGSVTPTIASTSLVATTTVL